MKKITKATLKSFVKKNADNLLIDNRASFDGQIDGLSWNKDGFKPALPANEFWKYNLGYKGIWLVGSSNNYFKHFENDEFIGIEVSNCCGYFTVAIRKVA